MNLNIFGRFSRFSEIFLDLSVMYYPSEECALLLDKLLDQIVLLAYSEHSVIFKSELPEEIQQYHRFEAIVNTRKRVSIN